MTDSMFDVGRISRTPDVTQEEGGEPHDMKEKYFNRFSYCEVCGDFLWGVTGKQGLQCTKCGLISHFKCQENIPNTCRKLEDHEKRDASMKKWFRAPGSHSFKKVHFERGTWCNVCGTFAVGIGKQGLKCIVCHYISHKKCHCATNRPCKCECRMGDENASNMKHEWVLGNNTGECKQCGNQVKLGLETLRCVWCKLVCHTTCADFFEKVCNLGEFRRLIIPPYCVSIDPGEPGEEFIGNNSYVADLSLLEKEITPLICFVNPKSGDHKGEIVAAKFKKYLNPAQVFDLSEGGPAKGLEFAKSLGIRFSICVAGGDGTVCWILSEVDKYNFPFKPPVGIVPLGTGNDLSRAFGWGPGYSGGSFRDLLKALKRAKVVLKDRWAVYTREEGGEEKLDCLFNNYISFGCDAKICLEFHLKREANPEQFKSRNGNKLKYVKISTKNFFKSSEHLTDLLTLMINGEPVELGKDQQGLIVTNIPSYMSGTNIWGSKKGKNFKRMGVGDGLLEITTVSGSLHLGKIKSGVSSANRIAQVKEFTVEIVKDIAVQIDGEPWLQKAGSVMRIVPYAKDAMFVRNIEEMQGVYGVKDDVVEQDSI